MFSKPIRRAQALSPSQIRHLLRVTEATSRYPERDAVTLLLGLSCGMRISEIAQVTVSDFCFADGRLRQEVSLRATITKGCRQRCIYVSSAKLIAAIERYLKYRCENDLGMAFNRNDYRGLNRDLPLILSRKGYPYSLTKKRRVGALGEPLDYWAADSLQAYVTGLYQAAGTNGTSHSGLEHSRQGCFPMARPSSKFSCFSATRALTKRAGISMCRSPRWPELWQRSFDAWEFQFWRDFAVIKGLARYFALAFIVALP